LTITSCFASHITNSREAKSWEFQFMHDGCHCDECGAPMPYPPDDPRWEEEDE
jgi:hypothetical protein